MDGFDWILLIVLGVCACLFVLMIIGSDAEITYGGYGICTEKYTTMDANNVTDNYYVVMDTETFEIDSQMYKGIMVGTMYHYEYAKGTIRDISVYAEDSGL